MTDYKATPEHWVNLERRQLGGNDLVCAVLELRARVEALEDDSWKQAKSTRFCVAALVKRIEALEANSKPTPKPIQIRSSLVERVAIAVSRCEDSSCWDDEAVNWEPEARAAIREVAAALVEWHDSDQFRSAWEAAKWLEQEAKR
jgi:hypothetical protein